jgi:hypothetical protein
VSTPADKTRTATEQTMAKHMAPLIAVIKEYIPLNEDLYSAVLEEELLPVFATVIRTCMEHVVTALAQDIITTFNGAPSTTTPGAVAMYVRHYLHPQDDPS